jgi:hypothetical protein
LFFSFFYFLGETPTQPENLLLGTADDYGTLTLIDFGLSRFFEPGQRLMTRVGTVRRLPDLPACCLFFCLLRVVPAAFS